MSKRKRAPRGLSIRQAAKLLRVPEATIRRHIEAGAPVGPDGRVNLVHYAAWLVLQLAGERRPP